jgi:protein involved in polysaccharide export with SLBB domain
MTSDEATEALKRHFAKNNFDMATPVNVVPLRPLQPIKGEHLVAPDGTVNLGSYGQVMVAGLTIKEATAKIEEHLSAVLEHPQVVLSVFAYNSKVFYVIMQGGRQGDEVTRLPVTGNETVLDALSQVEGLSGMANKSVWIARPAPGTGGCDTILPVNWRQITEGAATATNYQVLPGDRVFVVEKPADPSPALFSY